MKLFEPGWDHVGAKTWVAKPARTNPVVVPRTTTVRAGELSRRPSIGRLDTTGRVHEQPQAVDEQARRMKELRLAELTRQLELTQLQHPSQPASAIGCSRPISPLSRHSLDIAPPKSSSDISHEHLVWQRKLQEADELNARIEALRQSGMPSDQLPSPIILPSRPASRPPTIPPTRPTPHDYYHHDTSSFAPDPVALRHQPSKKSFHSLSNYPSKPSSPVPPPPPPASSSSGSHHHTSQQREGGNRVSSVEEQASYYQALKDAEEVISKLRKSHDQLLEKVHFLEEQIVRKDAEIGDLNTRNTRLETYLADEQTAKDHLQRDNDRAMAQLRALSRHRDQTVAASNPPRPVEELRGLSGPAHVSATAAMATPEKIPQQNISNARAELLKREEMLDRQCGYSLSSHGSVDPAMARPGSRMASPAPAVPPPSQGTYPAHHLYHTHPLPRSTPLRPTPLPLDHHLPRSTTTAAAAVAYPHQYLHQSPSAPDFLPSSSSRLPPFSHFYPPY
ncbi:hypothetical protein VP01_843g9 [Puccinia sorghi]|uniref:Uncharacterized protein n=1 Tax=Puccinia sorghi TaxID=27349 RepID=A0A0L6UBF1_9BASI|nr:hypothetical protein VP01_843g9 [Puccinia sorghi]